MPNPISLTPDEAASFSLPHAVRLAGEHQHLVGAGSIAMATTFRSDVEVSEGDGPFTLTFKGGDEDGWTEASFEPAGGGSTGSVATWSPAIEREFGVDDSALEGLSVVVHLGELWQACPPGVLATCPTVAVAVSLAVAAHRQDARQVDAADLALSACRLRAAVLHEEDEDSGSFYPEALTALLGGVAYFDSQGDRVNVQEMVPPESLLLALAPGASVDGHAGCAEREARAAVQLARAEVGALSADDQGLSALFGLAGGPLTERQVSMLYGLLRVQQMTDAFVESLVDVVADNDRLAEMCDEESAIMHDYFAFPGHPFAAMRSTAVAAGALGARLTWAFGGWPAAVVVAPGRREEVLAALRGEFADGLFLPFNLETTGLSSGPDRNDR